MKKLRTKLRTKLGPTVGLISSSETKKSAARDRARPFTCKTFLANVGHGKTKLRASKDQLIYSQGDESNAVFYVRTGRVKLTVCSKENKEAVVAILNPEDFFGEGCLAGQLTCATTATALDESVIMRIDKATITRVLRQEASFTELFIAHLLSHSVRTQKDLVDHLFNSTEKRLARALLLLARYGEDGEPEGNIPKISQEELAEMVGTTRSRVKLFLDKFNALGFITNNGTIEVHSSLLNIVLHD